jgi:hypothetical protein
MRYAHRYASISAANCTVSLLFLSMISATGLLVYTLTLEETLSCVDHATIDGVGGKVEVSQASV